jgi:structural maintenance of chromosome 2
VSNCRNSYEKAKDSLVAKQTDLAKCSSEIKQLEQVREKHTKAVHSAQVEARKCQHTLKQWEKEFAQAQKQLQMLIKQHPWIEREKDYFGVSGSAFDFGAYLPSSAGDASGSRGDVSSCSRRLKDLKSEQDKLSKKINKKVIGMIEKAESEYAELARKREVPR